MKTKETKLQDEIERFRNKARKIGWNGKVIWEVLDNQDSYFYGMSMGELKGYQQGKEIAFEQAKKEAIINHKLGEEQGRNSAINEVLEVINKWIDKVDFYEFEYQIEELKSQIEKIK